MPRRDFAALIPHVYSVPHGVGLSHLSHKLQRTATIQSQGMTTTKATHGLCGAYQVVVQRALLVRQDKEVYDKHGGEREEELALCDAV